MQLYATVRNKQNDKINSISRNTLILTQYQISVIILKEDLTEQDNHNQIDTDQPVKSSEGIADPCLS